VSHGRAEIWEERRYIVRQIEAGTMLERFLVSAVSALLLLRFYLELTGFPQVGGNGLHIAHLLWGGLLMLIALVLLLSFFGKTMQSLAAILGGIGFGLFVDEIGKFVTSNNNYFFQPAIAMIYVIFVLLFLVFRAIERGQTRSDQGYIVNALLYSGEAVLHGFDRNNRDRAMELLSNVPASNPFAAALRQALQDVRVIPDQSPGRLVRIARWGRETYTRLVEAAWFDRLVLSFFAVYALVTAAALAAIAVATAHESLRQRAVSLDGEVAFTALSDLLIVIGATFWLRSRLHALVWFERAVLVSILLTQPFLFYTQQLPALAWLALDVVLLQVLRYMIQQERIHQRPAPVPALQQQV
jgi:hypothetical protein